MSSSSLYFLVLVVVCLFSLSVASVGVVPPYRTCSSATAHLKIDTVEVNEWPPVSGDTLEVNMIGSVDETVTAGTYAIDVTLDGIAIPPITGNIDTFKPLPWDQGAITMSFPQDIPGGILSGTTCKLQISAVDQQKEQLFCITMSFTFQNAERTIAKPTYKTHFPVIHTPHDKKTSLVKSVFQRLFENIPNDESSSNPSINPAPTPVVNTPAEIPETPVANTPRIHTHHQ